ncbi:MAG: hypothetical protein JSS82_07020 [Bacteroidetes bacterium]|nr:hypothetical protein [Bacteroidota bacterium]
MYDEHYVIMEMHDCLSMIKPVVASKVNMWVKANPFIYPPFFRFSFRDTHKTDEVYTRLKRIIEDFNGGVHWTMTTIPELRNYVIQPKFSTVLKKDEPYEMKSFLNYYSEEIYKKNVESAILDIKALTEWIKQNISVLQ